MNIFCTQVECSNSEGWNPLSICKRNERTGNNILVPSHLIYSVYRATKHAKKRCMVSSTQNESYFIHIVLNGPDNSPWLIRYLVAVEPFVTV